ncbi:MAG: hypothetical protein AB1394_12395 [Bacteroidota bacterium]
MKKLRSNSIIKKIIIVHLCISLLFFIGSYLMEKSRKAINRFFFRGKEKNKPTIEKQLRAAQSAIYQLYL